MNVHSRLGGLLCGCLASTLAFAGPDQLGLSYRLSFGTAAVPAHMELSLQAETELQEIDRGLSLGLAMPVAMPLWSANVRQGQLGDTRLLGVAYGSTIEQTRLNAEGGSGMAGWLWGGAVVVGALVLVGVAAGGGQDKSSSGPGDQCTLLDPNTGDGDDLTVIGGSCSNLSGG